MVETSSSGRARRSLTSKERSAGTHVEPEDDSGMTLILDAMPTPELGRIADPDTDLHAIPGPSSPPPAWVVSAWQKAATRRQPTQVHQKRRR
jgi:hypothetical protein